MQPERLQRYRQISANGQTEWPSQKSAQISAERRNAKKKNRERAR